MKGQDTGHKWRDGYFFSFRMEKIKYSLEFILFSFAGTILFMIVGVLAVACLFIGFKFSAFQVIHTGTLLLSMRVKASVNK